MEKIHRLLLLFLLLIHLLLIHLLLIHLLLIHLLRLDEGLLVPLLLLQGELLALRVGP